MPLNVETSENSTKEFLKTHYYKCNYAKLKKAVFDVLDELGFDLTNEDDEYYEHLFQRHDVNLTLKFNEFNQRETCIDFFIDAYYFLFPKSKVEKLMTIIYAKVNKLVEFKGLGLHPEVK